MTLGPVMNADDECLEGYHDGRDLSNPFPGSNRSPFYIHGFRCGRDDAEVGKGIRKFPSRTAQEARDDWALITGALA